MRRCFVLFVSLLETNRYDCQYIKSSAIKTSTTECTSSYFEKSNKSDSLTVDTPYRKNILRSNVYIAEYEANQCFENIESCLFEILMINQIGAYTLKVNWRKRNNNLDYKSNKILVLCQESSVFNGNKVCVNTFYYHFAVINNVAWLIIGLHHIKCIIVFLMLQISISKKLLILQSRHKLYIKLHNQVRVVYPLTK